MSPICVCNLTLMWLMACSFFFFFGTVIEASNTVFYFIFLPLKHYSATNRPNSDIHLIITPQHIIVMWFHFLFILWVNEGSFPFSSRNFFQSHQFSPFCEPVLMVPPASGFLQWGKKALSHCTHRLQLFCCCCSFSTNTLTKEFRAAHIIVIHILHIDRGQPK